MAFKQKMVNFIHWIRCSNWGTEVLPAIVLELVFTLVYCKQILQQKTRLDADFFRKNHFLN